MSKQFPEEDNRMEEEKRKEEERRNTDAYAAAGRIGMKETVRMQEQVSVQFHHPAHYKGNRKLYDSGSAKLNAKKRAFSDGKKVVDSYTGENLCLTKREAKALYGEQWKDHLAESDHIHPLEKVFDKTKDRSWLTNDDIKEIGNDPENLRIQSHKFNNAKRSRTNREFVEDEDYLREKGVNLKQGGKQRAIQDGERAERKIEERLHQRQKENALKTSHQAGLEVGKAAGITALGISGVNNLVALAKGEKTVSEALADTAADGGKAFATAYITSRGLILLGQSFSKSTSPIVQGLMKSNVPGRIVNSVMTFGGTLKDYGQGKISTSECMVRLGSDGTKLAASGAFALAGQAMIPIPYLGAAIGMAVGNILIDSYYEGILGKIQQRERSHQHHMEEIVELEAAAKEARAYRAKMKDYLDNYFFEYRSCFDDALSSMRLSFEQGDTDGVIAGANLVTEKLGGAVTYRSVEEFRDFFDSDETDIF